jgi:predicted ribosome quality control (RQC) complex YloA/Tae2 family protein
MKTENIFIDALKREVIFYIGKTQSDNFKVIDLGKEDDLWFHAKDISSCHVVAIIPENEDFTHKELLTIIKKGASLCKENTTKLNEYSNVEIIYTKLKNVIKTKTPGCVNTCNTKTIVV